MSRRWACTISSSDRGDLIPKQSGSEAFELEFDPALQVIVRDKCKPGIYLPGLFHSSWWDRIVSKSAVKLALFPRPDAEEHLCRDQRDPIVWITGPSKSGEGSRRIVGAFDPILPRPIHGIPADMQAFPGWRIQCRYLRFIKGRHTSCNADIVDRYRGLDAAEVVIPPGKHHPFCLSRKAGWKGNVRRQPIRG